MKNDEVERNEVQVVLGSWNDDMGRDDEFQLVRPYLGNPIIWDVNEFIELLGKWAASMKEKSPGCHRFEVRPEIEFDDGMVEKSFLKMVGFRWETDDEFEKRSQKVIRQRKAARDRRAREKEAKKAKKQDQEAKERKLLAQLKEKYE